LFSLGVGPEDVLCPLYVISCFYSFDVGLDEGNIFAVCPLSDFLLLLQTWCGAGVAGHMTGLSII
jgi:hypothetical protein